MIKFGGKSMFKIMQQCCPHVEPRGFNLRILVLYGTKPPSISDALVMAIKLGIGFTCIKAEGWNNKTKTESLKSSVRKQFCFGGAFLPGPRIIFLWTLYQEWSCNKHNNAFEWLRLHLDMWPLHPSWRLENDQKTDMISIFPGHHKTDFIMHSIDTWQTLNRSTLEQHGVAH